jgi:hypothetical protein
MLLAFLATLSASASGADRACRYPAWERRMIYWHHEFDRNNAEAEQRQRPGASGSPTVGSPEWVGQALQHRFTSTCVDGLKIHEWTFAGGLLAASPPQAIFATNMPLFGAPFADQAFAEVDGARVQLEITGGEDPSQFVWVKFSGPIPAGTLVETPPLGRRHNTVFRVRVEDRDPQGP